MFKSGLDKEKIRDELSTSSITNGCSGDPFLSTFCKSEWKAGNWTWSDKCDWVDRLHLWWHNENLSPSPPKKIVWLIQTASISASLYLWILRKVPLFRFHTLQKRNSQRKTLNLTLYTTYKNSPLVCHTINQIVYISPTFSLSILISVDIYMYVYIFLMVEYVGKGKGVTRKLCNPIFTHFYDIDLEFGL